MAAFPVIVASAPGRVNLIGEHLDYNGGRCLPIALPLRTRASVARLGRPGLEVVAAGTQDHPAPDGVPYVAGVLAALGVEEGLRVDISSDVPIGAGLSSSAALTCSVAVAVDALLDLGLSREELVTACVVAETEHVGAPTGGLDQNASVHCRAGEALLLDFAGTDPVRVPFAPEQDGLELLVVDTGVSHAHADGEYGDRRSECEEAARVLGLERLAHAGPADLGRLPEVLARRARHVVSEQVRVTDFVDAAASRDWPRCGELMTASHASLRDDFAVSCAELDTTVEAALSAGALGARMTGGGFGGSAIALVPTGSVADVRSVVDRAFAEAGRRRPAYHPGTASDGARVESATSARRS